ncbi:MAG: tetratricopeptide repeat protein [Saprospiraceae bacterium]|nr:tetratricopeptide repeat protein [Saprospiraceae bacterium]
MPNKRVEKAMDKKWTMTDSRVQIICNQLFRSERGVCGIAKIPPQYIYSKWGFIFAVNKIRKLMTNIQILFCTILLLSTPLTSFAQTNATDPKSDTIQTYRVKLSQAQKSGNASAIAKALCELGQAQTFYGSVLEGIETSHRAIDSYERLNDLSGVAESYVAIVYAHFVMRNYAKAQEYSEKALAIARQAKDTAIICENLDKIGMSVGLQKQYDKAIEWHLEALTLAKKVGFPCGTIQNNLAAAYSDVGDYEKTLSMAIEAEKSGIAEADSSVIVFAVLNQSGALAKLGRFAEAEKIVRQVEQSAALMALNEMPRNVHQIKSIIADAKGDFKAAYQEFKQFHTLDSLLSSEEHNAQFAQLETAYQTKKKEQENERLTAHVQQQRILFGAVACILLLLGGLLWMQRKRLRTKNQLLETEQALTAEKLQRTQQELVFNKAELSLFTQSLREKVDTIQMLERDLSLQNASIERNATISQLKQTIILTDEQWVNFRQKFERVHVDFFNNFYQLIPTATEAEKRFAALVKLNLSDTEMAATLGISTESIVKTRYRLRKKVDNGDAIELVRQL